jgi:hypothetical protein
VLPLKTIKNLNKLLKLRKGAFRFVSARHFEAMGDPRNKVSFYCADKVGFVDRPAALRFNCDNIPLLHHRNKVKQTMIDDD